MKTKGLKGILKTALLSTLIYSCSPTNDIESVSERLNSESQRTNTVLIGGHHYETEDDYVFREYLLPVLANNGYNHLALEVDQSLQPLADNPPYSVPGLREAIKQYSNYRQTVDTILRADDLGFQIHFVDDFELGHEGPESLSKRNERIAENIRLTILDDDPNAKIVAFFGASHIPKEPFFRPDAGMVFPLGYYLVQERRQEPYALAILPHYKVDQYKRFEAKNQSLDILCLDKKYGD